MFMRLPLGIATLALLGVVYAQPLFPNSDFETGELTHWTARGSAFARQPVKGDNAALRGEKRPALPAGEFWVGTYDAYRGQPGESPGAVQGDRPQGTLLSDVFTIDGPYIAFLVGGGSSDATRVDLIVSAEVVHSTSGAGADFMRRAYWDVRDYAGQDAMIHIIDRSSDGWGHINADDFRFVSAVPDTRLFPNSDFESGTLENWTATGDAFTNQPTKGDNVAARLKGKREARPAGAFWIGTFERYQGKPGEEPGSLRGDEPTGTLRSVDFPIGGTAITFLLGGGKDDAGARLLIDGIPVATASGANGPQLRPVVWDVSKHMGKTAVIEVFDSNTEKPWGFVSVDDFRWARGNGLLKLTAPN